MSESKATPSWSRRLRYRLEHAALCAVVWFIPKLPLRLVRWAAAVRHWHFSDPVSCLKLR